MRILHFLPVLLYCGFAAAQSLNAVSTSNLSGIYGSLANPAFSAGSIDRLNINIAGIGFNAYNNVLQSDLKFSMIELATFKAPRNEEAEFQSPYVSAPRKKVLRPSAFINVDIIQFAVQLAITKKLSLFSYSRERAFGNISNLDYRAVGFLSSDQKSYPDQPVDLSVDAVGLSYQELGFGSSFQVYEHRDNYVKAGVTYKLLNGRAIYGVHMPYFRSSVFQDQFSIQSEVSILETSLDLLTQNPTDIISKPRVGSGRAFDFGLVYEHRPRSLKSTYRKNNLKLKSKHFNARDLIKYDYRIAVSLLDVGKIAFNQNAVTRTRYTLNLNQNVDDYLSSDHEDILDLVQDSAVVVRKEGIVNVCLPTTLNLMFDQRLRNNYFVSIQYAQRLSQKREFSSFVPSNVLVQIRKETKHCSFGLPLLMMPSTRTYTVGASVKTGPLFFGTNNLSTFIFRKFYNPSVYAGFVCDIRYKEDPTIETYNSFRTRKKRFYPWSPM